MHMFHYNILPLKRLLQPEWRRCPDSKQKTSDERRATNTFISICIEGGKYHTI